MPSRMRFAVSCKAKREGECGINITWKANPRKKEKEKEESRSRCPCYGFHTGALLGDLTAPGGREARPLLRGVELLKGVAGRRKLSSPSTRLRNCRAVKGEPGEECVLIDWGLFPYGVGKVNEGNDVPPLLGSGVSLSRAGVLINSGASKRVEELIHFSSLEPT